MNDSNDSLNLLFFQATFKAEVQELVQVRARKNRGMALQIQINISGQASQQRVSHCFSLIGSWGYSETQDIHIYIHSAASCKQIPPPRYVLADVARNHRNHRAMALNQSAYRRCPTQCLVTQLTPGAWSQWSQQAKWLNDSLICPPLPWHFSGTVRSGARHPSTWKYRLWFMFVFLKLPSVVAFWAKIATPTEQTNDF